MKRGADIVRFGRIVAVVAGLAAVPACPGWAAGDAMTITATVLPACHLDAGDMAFGTIEPRGAASESQAILTLDCTPGTAFSVTMDEGRNGGRRMADATGSAFLHYEIYQDAAARRRWGSDGPAAVGGVSPDGGRVVLSAYGRIAAERAAAGAYSDVVTVVVSF